MTTITIPRALLEQALANMVRAELLYGQPNQAIQEAIRAALSAPATAPEKTVKEIMEFVRHYAANTFSSATLEDKIRRALVVPATAPAQPEIVDLLAEMYELILANKVVLAEKSGGVWTWPDRAIEAVRKHRSGPAQPAWHVAPTVPGLWLNSVFMKVEDVEQWYIDYQLHLECARWFGPIPEDKS